MELTGVKCNRCGNRAFLEDPDTPQWMTSVNTIPGLRRKVVVHYCPACRDEFLAGIGETREVLDTGQRRVIDPEAPNRELEVALTMDAGSEERRDDLEKLGPPDPMPALPTTGPIPVQPQPGDWGPAAPATQPVRMQPEVQPPARRDRGGRGRKVVRAGRQAATRMAVLMPWLVPLLVIVRLA